MSKAGETVLVSGMKPTGRVHLGNYFGALKQISELQERYEATFFIADFHALTTVKDPKELRKLSRELALDILGADIDPAKVILYRQSNVPEVAELSWVFNCLMNVSYLMRAHAYKDAQAKGAEVNAGTFGYPMLMAADILIHRAHVVPVGEDQRQHVEYARDTAERFNATYGEIFPLPKPIIQESVSTIPGTDGRKMSKSYGNTISLFADQETIRKAVMGIPTDSKGVDEPKDPDACSVFKLHSFVATEKELAELRARYERGGIGYKEAKDLLVDSLDRFLTPFRERRASYEKDGSGSDDIFRAGGEKIRRRAQDTMNAVRTAIGLSA